MVAIGAAAPDFDLPGVDGATGEAGRWRLSECRGAPVVVLFYPGDSSPVCRRQLGEYTEGFGRFAELDATVLAVSHQSPESHRRFAEQSGGFAFPLLSDADKEVGRQWGVLGLLDLYRRCTFVLDAGGVVRYSHRSIGPGLVYRPVAEVVQVVAGLPSAPD